MKRWNETSLGSTTPLLNLVVILGASLASLAAVASSADEPPRNDDAVDSAPRAARAEFAPAATRTVAVPTRKPTPSADAKQVHVAVRILSLDETKLDQLGIDLRRVLSDEERDGGSKPVFSSPAAAEHAHVVVLRRGEMDLLCRLLTSSGCAKVLSRPQLITVDGRQAKLHAGGEFPILVSQENSKQSVDYIQFGTKCSITPKILPDGKLRVMVDVRNSELDDDHQVEWKGQKVPGLTSRGLDFAVEMPSGETAMLRGLKGSGMLVFMTPTVVESSETPAPAVAQRRPPSVSLPPVPATPAVAVTTVRPSRAVSATSEPSEGDELRSVDRLLETIREVAPDAGIKIRRLANKYLLSGTVREREDARVIMMIAEDFFPHRIVNDVRIDDGSSRSRAIDMARSQERIEQTIRKLFPEAEIEVHELHQSLVVTGHADRQDVKAIVRIAEDFYPSVINRLVAKADEAVDESGLRENETDRGTAAADAGDASSTKLDDEIRQLRRDVSTLRKDVARLIELLERQSGSSDGASAAPLPRGETAVAPLDPVIGSYEAQAADDKLAPNRRISSPTFDPDRSGDAFDAGIRRPAEPRSTAPSDDVLPKAPPPAAGPSASDGPSASSAPNR